MEMQEGLNINLMLSGATLASVLGLLAKVWLANRPQKIQQPLEVRAADGATPRAQCDERHEMIGDQLENLYGRVKAVEIKLSADSARLDAMGDQLKCMDGKLDTLLRRK